MDQRERVRVLVAEDEALIRLDLVESLRELGYDVVAEAGDGETALRLAESTDVDVALLDVSMPLLDGLSVAAELSANVTSETDSVALSANTAPPSPVVVDVPAAVAPRPSASLAGPDSAPKLMPAMVIGISRWIGFFAKRVPSQTSVVHFSR